MATDQHANRELMAVVVPAYNEERRISATLTALMRQTKLPDSIIVVDNGSNDQTAAIVTKDFPNVTLLHEPNKGTGFAVKHGFAYAIDVVGASIVARIDADSVPSDTWIERGMRYLQHHSMKQLVGGRIMPLRDDEWRRHDAVALWMAAGVYPAVGALQSRSLRPLLTHCIWGANMMVRSEAYMRAGGFPGGDIANQDEDTELADRVYHQYGTKAIGKTSGMVVYTSMRRVRHLGHWGQIRYYLGAGGGSLAEARRRISNDTIDVR